MDLEQGPLGGQALGGALDQGDPGGAVGPAGVLRDMHPVEQGQAVDLEQQAEIALVGGLYGPVPDHQHQIAQVLRPDLAGIGAERVLDAQPDRRHGISQQLLLGAEVVDQQPRAGANPLGQRPQGQVRRPVRQQGVDDGVQKFGAAVEGHVHETTVT